ncbi:MAG TPA: ornithine carbamoyltransferase, partial [Candidatus Angelobacter sp.]
MIGARPYSHAAQKTPARQPLVLHDLISVRDFSPEEIQGLFQLAGNIKKRPADFRAALAGKQLVLFFEKASLRTRL